MKTFLTLLLSTVFFFITVHSQVKCVRGDCQNDIGVQLLPGKITYVGSFSGGVIHGTGVMYYPDGSSYRGEWSNRLRSGYGIYKDADGNIIEGYWEYNNLIRDKDGNAISSAEFISKSIPEAFDYVQLGCVSGDCEDGIGKKLFANGGVYEGHFQDGLPYGFGEYQYPNGDVYVGNWEAGLSHGEGQIRHKGNLVTKATWHKGTLVQNPTSTSFRDCTNANCSDGKGKFRYKNCLYIGDIVDGRPKGMGKVIYDNGDVYEGEWLNNSLNGYGTYISKETGKAISGFWLNNNFQGKDIEILEEGGVPRIPEGGLTSIKRQKVWAVIVGVSDYNHMPRLSYTDDDAYNLMIHLASSSGGSVPKEQMIILVNDSATRHNILSSLEEYFSKAQEGDLVIFYFSGHGLNGSFLPIDYKEGADNRIYHHEIDEIFKSSKASYKVCIADACHSGSYFQSKGNNPEDNISSFYQNLAKAAPGTALLMSSKAHETSLESNGLNHGVFSHFLIEGLKGKADANLDKIIQVKELSDYVTKEVYEYTNGSQTPVISGEYDDNMPLGVVE